ncbi:site-specific integrase [Nitrincola tapanii]|uniref:Uncharacterized protein n=1 Tax=Nitrincola tapanii TaxID=1708751 RepID=A0A5A9W4I5_9GAMM|nr:hypothetical protein [Nitrincola tapanii]KAA0874461.1 hypothetical protein E1H14_09330 [Nitrincola tapanii]
MGKAGLGIEIRNRLQNHALTDVASVRYDLFHYWKQKKEASAIWEDWLIKNVVEPSTKLPEPVKNGQPMSFGLRDDAFDKG